MGDDLISGKNLLTYIDVPVLLEFHLTPNNPFFNIQAGHQLGFLIRATDIREVEGDKYRIDITYRYKKTDFGLAFGIEFNLPIRVNLTLRYIHGLTTVSDFYERPRTYVLQLSAGYRLID